MPDLSNLKLPDAPDLSSLQLPDAPDLSNFKLPDAPDLSNLKLPDAPDLSSLTSSLPPNPLAVQPASALEYDPSSLSAPDLSAVKMPEMPEIDFSSVKLPEIDSAALLSKLTEAAAPLVKVRATPPARCRVPPRVASAFAHRPRVPRPLLACGRPRWSRARTADAACPRTAGAVISRDRPVVHRREGAHLRRDGAGQQRNGPRERRGQRRDHDGGQLLG